MNDDLLRERFGAITNPADDSDWLDVQRRVRRHRARRTLLVALAASVAVAVVAPAFGLHRVVIDFFEAEPAPERVQLDFARLGIGAPPGMSPKVIPNSARKVEVRRADGKMQTLWIAPTRTGGFCTNWEGFGGGCRERDTPRHVRQGPTRGPYLIGATWQSENDGRVTKFAGDLIEAKAERLVAEFADGSRVEIPLTWVSAPIDAGFYFYEVPEEHRRAGAHLTALVARNADGDVVARQTFELLDPGDVERPARLPDGELVSLPAKAIVEQARRVIDFTASTGARISLWTMPTRDGGRCYVYSNGGGCPPARWKQNLPMAAGMHGGRPVLFQAQVLPNVAVVELRFEDGTVRKLEPIEGFVLVEIGPDHYPHGKRLELAIARDASGRELQRHPFRTDFSGVYPCEKPVDIGLGVMSCP